MYDFNQLDYQIQRSARSSWRQPSRSIGWLWKRMLVQGRLAGTEDAALTRKHLTPSHFGHLTTGRQPL